MLKIYKTISGKTIEIDTFEKDTWVSLIDPTKEEIALVCEKTGAYDYFIADALDFDERSRIENEDDQTLIIINASVPNIEVVNSVVYSTIPIGIIVVGNFIITVSAFEIKKITQMLAKHGEINTQKRSRLTIQIMYHLSSQYIESLNRLEKLTEKIEDHLYTTMKNEQMIELLEIEKSLVYFTTNLRENERVILRLFRFNYLTRFEEDEDLLEDTLIEIKQAASMAEINSNILKSIRETMSSIISNNLNHIMKILASITIILTVPTMVFSFFGMNVYLGDGENPLNTIIIIIGTFSSTFILYKIMKNKNMF